VPKAAVAAVGQTYNLATQIVGAIIDMITGNQALDEVGGPLRIAQISGQVAQDGIINLLYFMAALSVNLALINLLPIPVLDGGHLLLYAAEAIRGKPLSRRVIEYAFRAGMVFVVSLMLLATWNDLITLKVIDFFRKIVS
jgi:regulator of sigma E protease